MNKKWLVVSIIACLFGIVCSSISLYNYIRIHGEGDVAAESFCSINEFIDCDVVEASSFAAVGGIPIAIFGLAYYAYILIVSLIGRFSKGFVKPTVAFAWWTSCLSVVYAVILGYISLFILNTVCLTCAGMYLTNILIFISLFIAMRIQRGEVLSFLFGYWRTVLMGKKSGIDFKPCLVRHSLSALILMFFIVMVVSASTSSGKNVKENVGEMIDNFYRQSKYDLNFDREKTAMWGTKDAPVTIVEFSDYRCSYCLKSAFGIRPFMVEYKKYLSYYFLNFPLDSACNHYMQQQVHPGACLGAKAGICAMRQGKFWVFHDALFRSESPIDMKLVKDMAKREGLDTEELNSCIESPETEKQLSDEIEVARRIYVTGTPSIFLNGRKLIHYHNPAYLRKIVERELSDHPKK